MKHIRTFENNYKAGEYWLIPTDERFKQSLVDIGVEKNEIQNYIDYLPDEYRNNYIFLYLKTDHNEYLWKPYEGQNRCWFLDQSHYVFNGNINITDYELNANKYNL